MILNMYKNLFQLLTTNSFFFTIIPYFCKIIVKKDKLCRIFVFLCYNPEFDSFEHNIVVFPFIYRNLSQLKKCVPFIFFKLSLKNLKKTIYTVAKSLCLLDLIVIINFLCWCYILSISNFIPDFNDWLWYVYGTYVIKWRKLKFYKGLKVKKN